MCVLADIKNIYQSKHLDNQAVENLSRLSRIIEKKGRFIE